MVGIFFTQLVPIICLKTKNVVWFHWLLIHIQFSNLDFFVAIHEVNVLLLRKDNLENEAKNTWFYVPILLSCNPRKVGFQWVIHKVNTQKSTNQRLYLSMSKKGFPEAYILKYLNNNFLYYLLEMRVQNQWFW